MSSNRCHFRGLQLLAETLHGNKHSESCRTELMSAQNSDDDSSQELLEIFVVAKRERFISSSLLKHLFTFYEDRYHI